MSRRSPRSARTITETFIPVRTLRTRRGALGHGSELLKIQGLPASVSAAATIVDLNDRIPFPDPIRLRELVDGPHAADDELCFADLRLQLLEAVERRQPGPHFRQQRWQVFPAQFGPSHSVDRSIVHFENMGFIGRQHIGSPSASISDSIAPGRSFTESIVAAIYTSMCWASSLRLRCCKGGEHGNRACSPYRYRRGCRSRPGVRKALRRNDP
jgi:hypothetical protein